MPVIGLIDEVLANYSTCGRVARHVVGSIVKVVLHEKLGLGYAASSSIIIAIIIITGRLFLASLLDMLRSGFCFFFFVWGDISICLCFPPQGHQNFWFLARLFDTYWPAPPRPAMPFPTAEKPNNPPAIIPRADLRRGRITLHRRHILARVITTCSKLQAPNLKKENHPDRLSIPA